MKHKKTEDFLFEGLGFPINLIECPMKKVLGNWVLDFDMNAFQLFVICELVYQLHRLSGGQLRFMRKYMELSITEFGERLGVSRAAIIKWEKEQTRPSPAQEIYIRMMLLEFLKKEELQKLYNKVKPFKLAESEKERLPLFSVHAKRFCI